MSLNPIALEFIFNETLFHFKDETQISYKNSNYLGDNQSNISIISSKKLAKTDLDLLSKILAALQLSFDDVAIIDEKLDYAAIIPVTEPKKIILFGLNPFEIGIKDTAIANYEIIEKDNIKILQSEVFESYHDDSSKKKALWYALKKLIV